MIGYSNEHLEECIALLYTAWYQGGLWDPSASGTPLEIFFCLCLQNRRKLAHRKNEILVSFCATVRQTCLLYIESKTTVYVKHVLLVISIKGWFESNKCLLHSSSQKLLLLFKKCFSLHFYVKEISKTIFWKSVTIIVYKDNLKPLSLFDVIF